MFTKTFGEYVSPGDCIYCKVGGLTIKATVAHDDSHGAPWDEEDGHGPVSEWTSRAKRPGERVLHDGNSKRYYDMQEATEIAARDGWDAPPYGGTKGEKAARAVEADFRNLRAWCNDEWVYVGIVLSVSKAGIILNDHAASLWGIAANYDGCNDNDYLLEVANELLDEAIETGRAALADLCAAE